jgi:hypothetical protein
MMRSIFLAILAVGLAGCCTPRGSSLESPVVTRLSPKEVIALAQKALVDAGFKAQPPDAYTLTYQVTPGAREWSVRIGPFSKDFQWVIVNDETKKAVVQSESGYPPMFYLRR